MEHPKAPKDLGANMGFRSSPARSNRWTRGDSSHVIRLPRAHIMEGGPCRANSASAPVEACKLLPAESNIDIVQG
jgi:hypothetical protein